MKTDRAMSASELKELSRSRLMEDVRAVVADAEDYLAASAGQSGEAYAAARMRLERTLDEVRAQVVGRIARSDREDARGGEGDGRVRARKSMGGRCRGGGRRFVAGMVDRSSLKLAAPARV